MDEAHAHKFLSNMELHIRSNLEAIQSQDNDEPECQIHPDDVSKVARQQDLQDRLNELCSLRDLFCQQSEALSLLQQTPIMKNQNGPPVQTVSQLQRVPSVSDFDDSIAAAEHASTPQKAWVDDSYPLQNKSFDETLDEVTFNLDRTLKETVEEYSPNSVNKFDSVFATLKHDYLDDDLDRSFNLDFEGTDSEIQDAISEIRKEADRMDVFLAIDQLHTMQSELDLVNKALKEQSLEAEDLKQQLEEKDQQISSLELERDLYKADSSRARDDLATCIAKMFDISEASGRRCDDGESQLTNQMNSQKQDLKDLNKPSIVSETKKDWSSTSCSSSQSTVVAKTVIDPNRKIVQRPSLASAPSSLSTVTHCSMKGFEPKEKWNSKPFDAVQIQKVFRKQTQLSRFETFEDEDSDYTLITSPRRHNSMPLSQRFPEPEVEKEHRMCGIFKRRNIIDRKSKADDISTMKHQLQSLHEMMEVSVTTSEKLRKKISIISRYYESVIRKLQEKNAKLKADKKRKEIDLINQIAAIEHEKRSAIALLERRIRQRDGKLAKSEQLKI
jgi:hypothetical protein